MAYSKKIFIFSVVFFMLSSLACMAKPSYVTITLPEEVVRESIRDALPLSIAPQSDHVEGTLVIESISRLEMTDNGVFLKGQILGTNMVVSTRIGNQDIRMRIGEFRYPLTCDLSFRYDSALKILFITPHLVQPEKTLEGKNANAILPVLALLDNREYPVSLGDIQDFNTEIGQRKISVAMEPVDVQISQSQVILKMVPKVRKRN